MRAVAVLCLGLFSSVSFASEASPSRVVSQVSVQPMPGQTLENGVLVIKAGEPIRLKFAPGVGRLTESGRVLYASATAYRARGPYSAISSTDDLTKYLYCAGFTGPNDPKDQMLLISDEVKPNSAISHSLDSNYSVGFHNWIALDSKSEAVIKLESNPHFSGTKTIYLNFATQESGGEIELYIRPSQQENEHLYYGAKAMTRAVLTRVKQEGEYSHYQTCRAPTASVKVKLRQ